MRRNTHGALKFSLGYAMIASVVSALTYAANDWRRPDPPHIHLGAAVVANLLGGVFVGMVVDQVKHLLTTRLRAAIAGGVIAIPLLALTYVGLYSPSYTWREMWLLLGVSLLFGGVIGAAAWLPDDD